VAGYQFCKERTALIRQHDMARLAGEVAAASMAATSAASAMSEAR